MKSDKPMSEQAACPCGSGVIFSACCGPYLAQPGSAPTAESLMRSRYTAYVRADEGYLLQTWHGSTRPACIEFDERMQWMGLEILSSTAASADDKLGAVEFIARYKLNGRFEALHETSRFVKERDKWCYLDGRIHAAKINTKPTARNVSCPCGSGKKYKRCCGR